MQIIGRGFLASHLARLSTGHPDVVALAAGVSCAANMSVDDFGREAALVYDTLRRCRSTGERLLFFSTGSSGMYGGGGTGRESDPVFPPTAYGRHKYLLEAVIRESGVDHLIVRLAHVVGENQPAHQLLPTLMRQVRSGSVTLHRDAERDLIDVSDVVTVLDALLTGGARGQVVNVASGVPVKVEDLVTELERRSGRRTTREYVDGMRGPSLSVERLGALLPDTVFPFPDDYFRTVLDRYPLDRLDPASAGLAA